MESAFQRTPTTGLYRVLSGLKAESMPLPQEYCHENKPWRVSIHAGAESVCSAPGPEGGPQPVCERPTAPPI